MITDNKISRTFSGPSIFLGITFLIPGVMFIAVGQWLPGAISLIIASFILLTFSGVEIDTEKREIKKYNKIFGFIKAGHWEPAEKYKGVTLVRMKEVQTLYSRSNRQTPASKKSFQIYLVNQAKKPEVAIKKCKTFETAQDSLDEFSIWLKLPVFSINRKMTKTR